MVLRILSDEFVVKKLYQNIDEARRVLDNVANKLLQSELGTAGNHPGQFYHTLFQTLRNMHPLLSDR